MTGRFAAPPSGIFQASALTEDVGAAEGATVGTEFASDSTVFTGSGALPAQAGRSAATTSERAVRRRGAVISIEMILCTQPRRGHEETRATELRSAFDAP